MKKNITVELVPISDGNRVTLREEKTIVGRGSSLGCDDKKISRNHAEILLKNDDSVFIKPTHVNPVFYRKNGGRTLTLTKDVEQQLFDNDEIGLLPSTFFFRVHIKSNDEPLSTDDNNNDNLSLSSTVNEKETKMKSPAAAVSPSTIIKTPTKRTYHKVSDDEDEQNLDNERSVKKSRANSDDDYKIDSNQNDENKTKTDSFMDTTEIRHVEQIIDDQVNSTIQKNVNIRSRSPDAIPKSNGIIHRVTTDDDGRYSKDRDQTNRVRRLPAWMTNTPIQTSKPDPITPSKSRVESTTPSKVKPQTPSKVQPSTPSKVQPSTPSKVQPSTPSKVQITTPSKAPATTPSKVQQTTPSKPRVEPDQRKSNISDRSVSFHDEFMFDDDENVSLKHINNKPQPTVSQNGVTSKQMSPSVTTNVSNGFDIDDDDEKIDNNDFEEDEPAQDVGSKPMCPFGASCYRKNPQHIEDYSH
ncbi:unnamed protein product [Didymodactylos carnosus]|uniref:Aprataxin and PNK-like factor n=1 Tax=Didymodactylos carnosus TaxID=1234261 RepID=A0A8S2IB56_9BILA|nr:unnamed protein product [Didymodactylos carnosus]CAF3731400.1 unnamed protein product [Didymodactylos carnosus]